MEAEYDKGALKEKVTHGTVSFPLATYYLDGQESFEMKPHWHGEFEILYLEKGKMRLKLNMEEITAEGPVLAFVEPGVIHSFWMEENPVESALVFDMKMLSFEYFDSIQYQILRPLLEGRLHIPRILTPESEAWDEILAAYLSILGISKRMTMGAKLRIKAGLYQILGALSDRGCFWEAERMEREDNHKLETMKQVLQEIHSHYQNRLTLDDLASMAGMNSQYFCRYFKRLTGKTITTYLNEIRIDKAAELLVNSHEKIIEIAGVCGFDNIGYFNKRFKNLKGSTPSQYREIHRREG